MKKYNQFIKEAVGQWVNIGAIYIKKNGSFPSISFLNDEIDNYVKSIYEPMGFKKDITSTFVLGGVNVNVQLMINNYTIFKRFIENNDIKSASDFVNKLIDNFDDVYHFNGDFFNKYTKFILRRTSNKGSISEIIAFKKFEDFSKSKGLEIEVQKPSTVEDKAGTDGYFEYKGKRYTLQVKPGIDGLKLITMSNVSGAKLHQTKVGSTLLPTMFKMKSQGSLSVNTDFLILYEGDKHIFIKNKVKSPILIKSKYFIFNKENIIYNDFDKTS